jgi:NAD(P)-dependent dehydrogenase (short-subunit alcohol dehydrogenase family)
MGKLEGKIALITGGNSGIGLATAKQFVSEGAYVFITGRRDQELAAAVKEIGRNVTGVPAGVSLSFPLVMLMSMLSAGAYGGGVASGVARALGAGRADDAARLAGTALTLSAMLGLATTTPWVQARKPTHGVHACSA